jgi:hypothetical protein
MSLAKRRGADEEWKVTFFHPRHLLLLLLLHQHQRSEVQRKGSEKTRF